MKKINHILIVCTAVLCMTTLIGCSNSNESAQNAAAAKTLPSAEKDPTVPAEVKAQVTTAVQNETQKMDAYSKQMSEQYKNNPPGIK